MRSSHRWGSGEVAELGLVAELPFFDGVCAGAEPVDGVTSFAHCVDPYDLFGGSDTELSRCTVVQGDNGVVGSERGLNEVQVLHHCFREADLIPNLFALDFGYVDYLSPASHLCPPPGGEQRLVTIPFLGERRCHHGSVADL